jgi:hypothetical protein
MRFIYEGKIALNSGMIYELEEVRKEAVVAYFKMPGKTEENHKETHYSR